MDQKELFYKLKEHCFLTGSRAICPEISANSDYDFVIESSIFLKAFSPIEVDFMWNQVNKTNPNRDPSGANDLIFSLGWGQRSLTVDIILLQDVTEVKSWKFATTVCIAINKEIEPHSLNDKNNRVQLFQYLRTFYDNNRTDYPFNDDIPF